MVWVLCCECGCQIVVGGCQIAVGGCQIAVGGCQIVVGGCQIVVGGCQIVVGGCQIAVGGCQIAVGGCQIAVGGCQIAVGGCQIVKKLSITLNRKQERLCSEIISQTTKPRVGNRTSIGTIKAQSATRVTFNVCVTTVLPPY